MMNVQLLLTLLGPAPIAGARTNDPTHVYLLRNSRLHATRLELLDNGVSFATFDENPGAPYNAITGSYSLDNAALDRDTVYNRAATSRSNTHLGARIRLDGRYHDFFYQMLRHWSDTTASANNFADPATPGNVTATFVSVPNVPAPTDTQYTVTFNESPWWVTGVPCEVTALGRTDANVMTLSLQLRMTASGLIPANQLIAMQYLMATEWRELFANAGAANSTWETNVKSYLLQYIPLSRGRTFIARAEQAGATPAAGGGFGALNGTQQQAAILDAVRAEVDRFLITSNPWDDPTNTGAYSHAVHIALAAFYNAAWGAMPIKLLRDLVNIGYLNRAQEVEMVSQMGMGNCDEHSRVTFEILRNLMVANPVVNNALRVVVRSGYVNVDHCFCVGGEMPVEIIDAYVHVAAHAAHKAQGSNHNIWDVWAAWLRGGNGHGRKGWICDPYLAAGAIAGTLEELIADQRPRQWLHWHNEIYPVPGVAIPNRADNPSNTNAAHIHVEGLCDAAPTVIPNGVAPAVGSTNGGTEVTISGTHFETRPRFVRFNDADVNLTTARVPAGNTIVCRTPAHGAAAARVTVRNFARQGYRSNVFTYIAPPVINNLSRSWSPVAGAVQVTINGNNFQNGAALRVRFDGTDVVPVFVSANQLTCNVPAHAAGQVELIVRNPDTVVSLPTPFRFVDAPAITGRMPPAGTVLGGTVVTINGNNFQNGAALRVQFDGTNVVPNFVSVNQLTCNAPAHAAGPVNVSVLNDDGQPSAAVQYTYLPLPTVANVNPPEGPASGNTAVAINGANFVTGAALRVSFDGTQVNAVFVSANQLTCVTPAHTAGNAPVSVINGDGAAGPSTANAYLFRVVKRAHD